MKHLIAASFGVLAACTALAFDAPLAPPPPQVTIPYRAPAPAPSATVPTVTVPLPSSPAMLSHGRFRDVAIHRPEGTPTSFVLFLSGDGGWLARDRGGPAAMVETLVADGAMVAAISTPQLIRELEADGGDCAYLVGDFENLSHFIQAWAKLPTYLPPILAGHAAGATLAYGVLAQAKPGSFAGALTTAFCPDLNLAKPFCEGAGVQMSPRNDGGALEFLPSRQLSAPWVTLHGEIDQACDLEAIRRFVSGSTPAELVPLARVGHGFITADHWRSAYRDSAARLESAQLDSRVPPPPSDLGELPVIEVAATGRDPAHDDTFAILISGDGGWAGIDKELASHLSAAGMPVIGVDSLRYFWTEQTPDSFAADLDRIIRHYRQALNRPRVLLIGYSQGADVLPFALNRLPAASRGDIALTVLLGLAGQAHFEFHLSSWVGTTSGGLPTRPEMARLQAAANSPAILCVHGEEDQDAICGTLAGPRLQALKLAGGHHFDGDYQALAAKLLAALPAGTP